MKNDGAYPKTVAMPGPVDYQDIPRKMKMEYNFPAAGKTYKILDQISSLLRQIQKPQPDLKELMADAGNLIMKQFSMRQVGIGLRCADGNYRYEVLLGYRADTEVANRSIVYTPEQFVDPKIYKGYMVSKYSKIFLAEDNPWLESEKEAYNLPSLLGGTRRSLDDYVEGDYIDIHILGTTDEILGWVELSGTTTGKLPDMAAIRWIEFIAQIIATAIIVHSRPSASK